MNTQVLLFLGKAALLTFVFVLMYRLLLRHETFHGLKRGALMLSLVLSYVLPMTVITVHRDVRKSPVAQTVASAQPAATPVNQIQPFSPVAQTSAPAPAVSASESATVQAPAVRKDYTAVLLRILLAAYLAGLIVMLLLRVRSILKVSAIVRGGETVERGDGYRIVVTDKNVSPFSWLGTIVVRQTDYAGIDSNVLRHEKAHIAHGHPLELMLLDFMSLFQWFNPAVWVLRRDLCLVHEQQADADVLKSVPDARPYQFMLLSQCQGGLAFNIVASFNGNGVESRIDMMNRKRSGRRQMLRFFYLPLVMCISLALTANVAYDMNAASESAAVSEEPVYGDYINPIFNVDDFWYYIENDGAVLCRHVENGVVKASDYNGPSELVIPSSIEHEGKTWPVTKIGEYSLGMFRQFDRIQRVVIPSSVTEIGASAFSGLPALESIYISKSVVKIADNLLGEEYTTPARIEIDPANPVYDSRENCNAIIETATNTLIVGRQGSVIPSSVTSIADNAFKSCKGLKSIVIPEGVKSIGKSAFEGCSGLTAITIPASVESIGSGAFFECTGIRSIKVAQGNRVFDSREDCNAIVNTRTGELILACASTIIPQGIKKIGYRAFYHCRLSNGLVLPEGIEEIADEAFAGCTGYSEIVLPASLKSLGKDVFGELKYDMQSITGAWQAFQERNQNNKATITSIKVNPANKYFDSREDCNALIRTKDNTLLMACENTVIPQSVKAIGEGAFKGLNGKKEIVLPKGLEHVGDEAFAGYKQSTPLSLPSTVKTIGSSAFKECIMTPELVIPGKVKEIGDYAFDYSQGIETISIGKGVKRIGICAFEGLDRVEAIVIPDGVETIGNFCFGSCSNLTSVSLPTSLKEIGTGAFQDTGLKEIEIPSGVKVIGPMTFTGCMSLVKVTLPKTLKRIEMGAFRGCPMLEQIHLPEGLEYIGDRAFESCRKFTEAFIPAGVKEIGKAPYDTRNITSIRVDSRNSRYESPQGSNVLIDKTTETLILGCNNSVFQAIPVGIKEIGYAAFDGCSRLENIVILDGVECIGDYAFRYCDTYITIPASVKEIGESSFLMTDPSKVTNNSGLAINHGQRSERQMIIAPSPEEIERMRQLINGAQ